MNYFAYWWTKLRLLAAGYAVRRAKKQVLLDIQNSRRITKLLENPYQRFIRVSAKREELAVRFKRLSGQKDGCPPILGMRFDAGETTLAKTAEDIPLYDRTLALARHQNGDWGGVTECVWTENNRNLKNGRGVVRSLYLSVNRRLFRIETDLTNSKTNIRWEREMNEPDGPNQKTDKAAA